MQTSPFKSLLLIGVIAVHPWAGAHAAEPAVTPTSLEIPDRELITLTPVAKLPPGPVKENSGIVRSRTHGDLFWMHNDSGDEPRVYAIRRNGAPFKSVREADTPGVLIGGAINVDWEDITIDSEANPSSPTSATMTTTAAI